MSSRECCPYCGNLLYTKAEKLHLSRENERTRDHVLPRVRFIRGLPPEQGIKNTHIVCARCNQLRAQIGHCGPVLMFLHHVAMLRGGMDVEQVAREEGFLGRRQMLEEAGEWLENPSWEPAVKEEALELPNLPRDMAPSMHRKQRIRKRRQEEREVNKFKRRNF